MVDAKIIHKQLKALKFGSSPWNQAELRELPKIIHEDEKISECVNGFYEGGVALLVATEMRLLLIDKKPMRFLTVEDLRFDMINEIDYSHRLLNACITISTGSKTLKFTSMNQPRLRHLIELVQQHMSNGKKEQNEKADSQQHHLQEINQQLQMYLMAQHQQLQQQLAGQAAAPSLPKPDPKLSDYLFAQRLLEQFQRENGGAALPTEAAQADQPQAAQAAWPSPTAEPVAAPMREEQPAAALNPADLIAEARKEVFGKPATTAQTATSGPPATNPAASFFSFEVNPLKVAYSKLPMMLRNRKFGRPSLHAHSQQMTLPTGR